MKVGIVGRNFAGRQVKDRHELWNLRTLTPIPTGRGCWPERFSKRKSGTIYEESDFRNGLGMVSTSSHSWPWQWAQCQGANGLDSALSRPRSGPGFWGAFNFKLSRQAFRLLERRRLARKPKLRMRMNPLGRVWSKNLRKNSMPSSSSTRFCWPVR